MEYSGYYPDLSAFSLEQLKIILENLRLLPGQKIIGQDIDERFACFAGHGIENLQQLQTALKSKGDVQSFATLTGLPVDYQYSGERLTATGQSQ